MSPMYPADLYDGCPCAACQALAGPVWRMCLCPKCGNKQLPRR
jgi:hypothetical protein